MPAPIHYSHQILKKLASVRKADTDSILGPDVKPQITLRYDDDGTILGVDKLVVSTQHSLALLFRTSVSLSHHLSQTFCQTDGWLVKMIF